MPSGTTALTASHLASGGCWSDIFCIKEKIAGMLWHLSSWAALLGLASKWIVEILNPWFIAILVISHSINHVSFSHVSYHNYLKTSSLNTIVTFPSDWWVIITILFILNYVALASFSILKAYPKILVARVFFNWFNEI